MHTVIVNEAETNFIQTVKMDHLCTKVDAYRAFNTGEQANGSVTDHTQCRLGQWYYHGEGKNLYQKESAFQQLEEPHKLFHNNFKLAMDAAAEGNKDTAYEHLADMEKASQKVMDCLARLEHKMNEH